MQAILEPGDHVVVTFPGYQSLYEIARSLGCRVTRWTLQAGERGWGLDVSALSDSLTPQTKLLVINFPHNPTGYLPAGDELDAIVNLARTRGICLFSDEMYRLLEYQPAQRLPPVCDLYPRGVSLFGLSKTFSLPGLRVGWLATQDRTLLERFSTLKDYTTICSSAPSEILALIALRARETIVARNLALIQRNLEVAERFFEAHGDRLDWLRPRAGSVAFPRLRDGLSAERFCQDLLGWGVMAVPGGLFEFPGEHFRLGLGRENLPQALERVGDYFFTKSQ
jgi:aspartate/methionine/tyrosine aminotransferase